MEQIFSVFILRQKNALRALILLSIVENSSLPYSFVRGTARASKNNAYCLLSTLSSLFMLLHDLPVHSITERTWHRGSSTHCSRCAAAMIFILLQIRFWSLVLTCSLNPEPQSHLMSKYLIIIVFLSQDISVLFNDNHIITVFLGELTCSQEALHHSDTCTSLYFSSVCI